MGVAANDFDAGNDVDLVVTGQEGALTVIMNLRDEKWSQVELPGTPRAQALAADFNGDGLPDLLGFGNTRGASLFLNTNRERARSRAEFAAGRELDTGPGVWFGALAEDLDLDGDLDCVLWGEGLCILRNRGAGTFDAELHPESRELKIDNMWVSISDSGHALSLNFREANGEDLHSWTVEAPKDRQARVIVLDGRKDNRDGVGAIVEVFAGAIYLTRMVTTPGPLRFGIGSEELDGFAIRWPQGIRQSVVGDDLKAMQKGRIEVRQKQGLVASCPFLFTKTTAGWKFRTDVVAIAPLDEWLPQGVTPSFDPEEFVRLRQEELAIENGRVQLAITEELREITYLDRVELYYLDLDPSIEVLTDESTRQAAYGPLRYFSVRPEALSDPRSVTMNGVKVGDLVSKADRSYLHAYRQGPSQLQGWGPRQEVELTSNQDARALVLSGRIAWYDSTTSYAMAQAELGWETPRIELRGPDGGWEPFVDNIGFPAGMDRSLVVPFPRALPAGSTLRLVSNQRFMWDHMAFLSEFEEHSFSVQADRPLSHPDLRQGLMTRAELIDRGYSVTTHDTERHEQDYLWRAEPRDDFPRPQGQATDFGDVRDRLRSHDDDFCILVSADAVIMEFEVAPIKEGSQRVWFLRITGWAKESSFHNRTGRDIAPWPHRQMLSYPPTNPSPASRSSSQSRRVGH